MTQKILRFTTVKNITGYSRSAIYKKISQGSFPSPISLGERAVGWVESEINDWIDERINKSRSK